MDIKISAAERPEVVEKLQPPEAQKKIQESTDNDEQPIVANREDQVSLSPQAIDAYKKVEQTQGADNKGAEVREKREAQSQDAEVSEKKEVQSQDAEVSEKKEAEDSSKGLAGSKELSPEEKLEVKELEKRDREVRAHEQAHIAAAGGLATGGASYSYERGPDNKQYAVGGEVNIKIPEGQTPQETIRYARQAKRAALAPKDPSAKDRQVAGRAARKIQQAQAEIREQQLDKSKNQKRDGNSSEIEATDNTGT